MRWIIKKSKKIINICIKYSIKILSLKIIIQILKLKIVSIFRLVILNQSNNNNRINNNNSINKIIKKVYNLII